MVIARPDALLVNIVLRTSSPNWHIVATTYPYRTPMHRQRKRLCRSLLPNLVYIDHIVDIGMQRG